MSVPAGGDAGGDDGATLLADELATLLEVTGDEAEDDVRGAADVAVAADRVDVADLDAW
jgi:hypothetical protein